jgi:hypothetical protein
VYRSRGRGWRRARGGEKRARARRPAPFEAEVGEVGEGWGSGARHDAWKGKRGRERGPRRGGGSSGGRHRPSAGGRRQRCCGVIVEHSGA